MTPEERASTVMEYAREHPDGGDPDFDAGITAFVLEHISEAVAEEREACAKIAADEWHQQCAKMEGEGSPEFDRYEQAALAARSIAETIRSRSKGAATVL